MGLTRFKGATTERARPPSVREGPDESPEGRYCIWVTPLTEYNNTSGPSEGCPQSTWFLVANITILVVKQNKTVAN